MVKPHIVKHYSKDDIAKIQYQCRRGMLELDVFLTKFCKNCFTSLSDEQKSSFIELLKQPDPDLFSWFMGYTDAKEKFNDIVHLIRKHQHNLNGD